MKGQWKFSSREEQKQGRIVLVVMQTLRTLILGSHLLGNKQANILNLHICLFIKDNRISVELCGLSSLFSFD